MTSKELRRIIADALQSAGFSKHFKSWILEGQEVSWIVSLDKRPSTLKYSLELGGEIDSIRPGAPPQDSNHCQIILHLERLELGTGFTSRLPEALDLGSELDDDEREFRIKSAISAAVGFMQDRITIEALRRSYKAGELIGFVLKPATELFEDGSG